MAKDVQSKKRKASVPEGEVEKIKKVTSETAEVPAKKRKATEDAAPATVKKSKTPKSTAEDVPKSKSAKKDKPTKDKNGIVGILKNGTSSKKRADVKDNAEGKSEKATTETTASNDDEQAEEGDDESEIDDQTESLLQGFESDGDDAEAVKEGGLKPGQNIPKVPTMTNRSKKQLKRLNESNTPDKPGVVYIGRIPHGFYENEMRAYFSQFGNILKLRLSRNRKTGQSKHYAWIQFESATVAEIVAKTMDSYLLFNHILKVKVVPDEQIPKDLFKGANKRFKKVPWNKIAGRKLEEGASEEMWKTRIGREEERREEKAEKMKELGYEFESPQIKSAKGVAKKPAAKELPANDVTKAIEAAPVSEDSKKPKKKKEKKPKKNEIFGIDVEEGARLLVAKEAKEAERAKRKEDKKNAKAAEEANAIEKAAPTAGAEESGKLLVSDKKRKADEDGNEKSGEKKKKQKKDKKAKVSA